MTRSAEGSASRARIARSALLLFLAVASAVLVACARSTSDPAPVMLKFWGLGHEGEVVGQLIPEFERRNPGIRVRVQQIPWSAAHEKLLTGFVGETTPDVAQMGNTWIPEFVAIGALQNLSPRLAKSSVKQSDFFPGIWATNVVGGTPYGIPWYVDTRVLFYRTDLLAEAGVTRPPQSWTEWLSAMEKVKSKGSVRYAILLPTNEWEHPTMLALQQGSTLLRDGDRFGGFRQPPFAKAFTFYVELFRKGYAPALANTQIANVYQSFDQGEFAMYITGPWNVGEFRKRLSPATQKKWTTAPMPAPDGMTYPGASLAGGSSLVMFTNSKQSDAAWKLIEYLSAPEQQIKFFELTRDLPAHRAAWKVPALARDREMQAFFQQLEHVVPLPRVPEWEQIATAIYENAESAIRGKKSIPQALESLDAKADRTLTKRRWVLSRKGES